MTLIERHVKREKQVGSRLQSREYDTTPVNLADLDEVLTGEQLKALEGGDEVSVEEGTQQGSRGKTITTYKRRVERGTAYVAPDHTPDDEDENPEG